MQDLKQQIDAGHAALLALIERLVRLETPSADKAANDRMADMLQREMHDLLDCRTDVIETQDHGNHLAVRMGSGPRQILILGHFDTVHPAGSLARSPFRVDDGRIFGPGILDMKAGIAQAMFALHALQQYRYGREAMPYRVVFLLSSDEEVGSPSSRPLLLREAKQSNSCFVLEPAAGAQAALKTGRKGVATYRVTAHGKAAHAGLNSADGRNAITEIAHQILALQALNDDARGITVNCGLVHGGVAKNTVPDTARLVVDVRAPDSEAADDIDARLRALSPATAGTRLEVKGGFSRPPMPETADTQALLCLAQDLMRTIDRDITGIAVGGASDANDVAAHVPTLDGLGGVGAGAHTPGEYVLVDHLTERAALLAALVDRCGRPEQAAQRNTA